MKFALEIHSPAYKMKILSNFAVLSHNAIISQLEWGDDSLLYESPSGNQVDGLPLVAHTGEDRIGPAPHP